MTSPRYAVLFKTHFWDEFACRQYERYVAAAPGGTVFICLDDESGKAGTLEQPHLLRAKHRDFQDIGLSPRYERGNLLWWNTDYFHYLFIDRFPDWDYLLAVEYDTCCLGDIDAFVKLARDAGADMVGLPIRTPLSQWMWTRFHARTYQRDALKASLNCISLFSARAVRHLFNRRRDMAAQSRAGGIPFWPGNEVFLATEIAQAGFRFVPLQEFGDVSRFEWHPPILEDEVAPASANMTFLHPVLDRRRYIASQLRYADGLLSYVQPRSALRRDLARFPDAEWRPHLYRAALSRLRMRARERLQGWTARLQVAMGAAR
jgi:hypothetical protein